MIRLIVGTRHCLTYFKTRFPEYSEVFAGLVATAYERGTKRSNSTVDDDPHHSFLRAFLHLKSFDGRSTFFTWLTRIGINSALMILRKKRNSREISAHGPGVDETLWEVPDSTPNPEIRYAERERERFLQDAIAGLRPRVRCALEFHTLQDHSLQETAAQIGIPVSAAKARVFHAKAALRKSKVLRKINEPSWHGLEIKGGEVRVH